MKPLVTIVIPVYNGENYLRQAINSALSQTYKPIEVLVVNDGSTDKTEEIALSYGNKIRYISKENGGVSTALNLGIGNMQGEYFSWLSHDDLYMPDKIEQQMNAIKDVPQHITYSDYTIIDKSGNALATMNIIKKYPKADLTIGLFPILRQVISGCSLMIHKSHFERVGHFNENLRATQDYDLWFKMFRGQRLVYVNEPLQLSREHGSQVTHQYKRNRLESDELWVQMLQSITKEEICMISGTEENFWNEQTEFLWYTPYAKARSYARGKLKEHGGGNLSLSKLMRRGAYNLLSGTSQLARRIGLQRTLKESKAFGLGYKLWFGVRYR